jgi:hypothetical protein
MKATKTFTIRLLLACILMLTGSNCVQAWDKTPGSNGKYDDVYDRPTYFPEWQQPSDWPNAMYYLCEARLWTGGPVLENYEIAVYDQNNLLRHCSRSIASDGNRCVLTIRGEEGDVFHFQVIYGTDFANPEVINVKDVTCSFKTNDIVGSEAPFELPIGEVPSGITENSKPSTVNPQQIYDLQGRLVSQPSRGLYIQNGRKRIIK